MTHCPDCGALTRKEMQDDGDEVLVCTDEDCPRIIVLVLSKPRAA